MSSERRRHEVRERILRLAETELAPEALRREVIAELRRALDFSAWCWPLADPETLLVTSGVADHDLWPVLPAMVAAEQLLPDVNKQATLARSRDPVGVLSAATGGRLARSARWQQIYGPADLGDELRVAFADAGGCWGYLGLHRSSEDPAFTLEDAALLRGLARPLAGALRRGLARPPRAPAEVPAAGVAVLDEELRLREHTGGAERWFAALRPAGGDYRSAVPGVVFAVAARLQAGETGMSALPPRVRIQTADGRWAVVEADRLVGAGGGVAVAIRAATPGEVLALLARAHGLSARERELVGLVVAGLDTAAIARRLGISRHTVQDHLKAGFAKVGVRSRRELVSQLLGVEDPGELAASA